MENFELGMYYTTELMNLTRLSFSDLKSLNMVYEKTLFTSPPTQEKIIIILQYIGNNIFKDTVSNIQIRMEPKHEFEETILRACDFETYYDLYEGPVLFVKPENLKLTTELDKYNLSKMNQANYIQLLAKIDMISKKQFSDEIKAAKMEPDEYIILASGEEAFKNPFEKKNLS